MSYRSNYVPKKHKVNYRIVVPFIIVLVSLIFTIMIVFFPKNQSVDTSYSICNLGPKESRNLMLDNNTEEFTTMSDYSFFGQTLGLYKEAYSPYSSDIFDGSTIILKNLCTDKEEVYLLGNELDNKIPLEVLDPGFYEVMVFEGFERLRLTSDYQLNEVFYTVSKNNEGKEVRLLADKEMFNNDGIPALNAQYVYLDVKNINNIPTKYDIVVDPNGLFDDGSGYISPGLTYDNFIESDELYDLSEKVIKILTDQGYRARITRTKTDGKDFHGKNGRIFEAYEDEAKYYVHLSMLYDTIPETRGATAIYSNNTSASFAQRIASEISSQTSLPLYDYGTSKNGIYRTSQYEGLDLNAILRETGGRYTGAGTVNERFQLLNDFAIDINRGIQSIVVELGYISNPETYKAWYEEKDMIAQALADAIVKEIEK